MADTNYAAISRAADQLLAEVISIVGVGRFAGSVTQLYDPETGRVSLVNGPETFYRRESDGALVVSGGAISPDEECLLVAHLN